MKHLLWLVLPGALLAQSMEGTWQGTLQPNPNAEIRMVFQIAKNGDGYQGTFVNLGNGRQVPLGAITLQGNAVKIAIPGNGMNYEGKFEADRNSITGALIQGTNNPVALALKRATAETTWEIPAPPAPPTRMAENTRLAFEVATIKPAPPEAQNKPFRVRPGQIEILNRSVAELILEAFPLHASQIIGAKGWMASERFDITGKPDAEGEPNIEQLRQLVRNLLTERFQMKFHMEERELPVYAITMGKTGQYKMEAANVQRNLPGWDFRGAGVFLGRNTSTGDLAEAFQMMVLDRPVVDRTGITGRFAVRLEWRPDDFQFDGRARSMQKPPNVDSLPDLFTAFQEQLGLKLEALKAPAPVLVIDSAQRPSEN